MIFLDEDRSKEWIVIQGESVSVYASLSEAKATRRGKTFSFISLVRRGI